MRKNQFRKVTGLALAMAAAMALLAGCGSKEAANSASAADTTGGKETKAQETTNEAATEETAANADIEVKKIIVGTSGSPKPWLWVEEDGSIAGYDAEVIYAIDKLLPQYEFEFEKTEFASLFTGVDSGRYTIAVNNFNWRADRAEKYLFGEEYVCYEKEAIYVRKGFDEIKTLEDVGGHKAFTTGTGLMTQLFLEEYNEQHPDNPVDLVYTDADTLKQFQDVNAGVADFGFLSQPSLKNYLEIYPTFYDDFDIIELTDEESEKVCSPFTYFIYAKTPEGEEVKAAVDEAIRTLKEDGTIKALSEEYIGYDVTGR
ncbi:MAG: transporter substrate-binding domain-containing protein [Butyrivibrio sp.]|nr:transporter substrate-binding domain-containing protein [Butyrivibrio sp.]